MLPDGRLASGSDDKTIRLWDIATGTETACLRGHTDDVRLVCILPGGLLASATSRTIWIWDLASGRVVNRFDEHKAAVGLRTMRVLAEGNVLSAGGELIVWNPATAAELRRLRADVGGGISTLCDLADGTIATGAVGKYSFDTMIRIRDVRTGEELACLKGHTATVWSLCALPDGRLASGSDDHTVRVWDLAAGRKVGTVGNTPNPINRIGFRPDGRVVTGSSGRTYATDHTLGRLWDSETGTEIRSLEGDGSANLWSTDAKNEVARLEGTSAEEIRWSTDAKNEVARLEGASAEQIRRAEASCVLSDGRICSGSKDRIVRLWEVSPLREVARIELDASVTCVTAVSAEQILVGDDLGRLHWIDILP